MDLHTLLIVAVSLAAGILLALAAPGLLAKSPTASAAVAGVEAKVETVEEDVVAKALAFLTDTSAEEKAMSAARASVARKALLAQHVVAQLAPMPAPDPATPAQATASA